MFSTDPAGAARKRRSSIILALSCLATLVLLLASAPAHAAGPPSISSLSSAGGALTNPALVTINGTNFSPFSNTVTFGGQPATIISQSTTALQVVPPNRATAGAVDVMVMNNGSELSTTATNAYLYVAPPTLTAAFSPDNVAAGTEVTLTLTLANSNPVPLSGVGIGSTVMPGGLTASLVSNTCAGGAPLVVGGAIISYNGGSLAANSGCALTFKTTPASDAYYTLTTGQPATSGSGAYNFLLMGDVATAALNVDSTPVASGKSGVVVSYNSNGAAIDLSSSITGPVTSVVVSTPPVHGTTSVSGTVVTYTPAAGYYGSDAFQYRAQGPGGVSNPASVVLTVSTPPAPVVANRSGVSVAYEAAGAPIDMSSYVSGVHSALNVGAPSHGFAGVIGDVVHYSPTPGYYGPDSFTYTATGPGGVSAPATISLTVAPPPAPTTDGGVAGIVVSHDTAKAIDLTVSISGLWSSLAIASAPAHGTTSIAGAVVTYTPASGYYGADSFTFTVTGPGGASSPGTVALTVAPPPAPVIANRSGIAVPYNSSGTTIDLSASITGVHDGIAVTTAPTHGVVNISGDVATYRPAAGYFGPDSFAVIAVGAGDSSAPATVSLVVSTPSAPVAAARSGIAVAYGSSGTAIDLSASITGVHTSLAIASGPAHGAASVTGEVVTYVPAAGYYGADSFTYTVTGPGGTSAPATVGLTVATPPAPTASARTATASFQTAVAIDVAANITGVANASPVVISTQPSHGSASVSGTVITYTPAAGYSGADSLAYTVSGPGGTSAAAVISITVAPPPITAPNLTGTTVQGAPVTINVTSQATGGPFTAANVVSVTTGAGTATAAAQGSGGFAVTFTPDGAFTGAATVRYTLSNGQATSAQATITVTVTARPDPTTSSQVNSLVYAEVEDVRRYTETQLSNFNRRLEQLHQGAGPEGVTVALSLAGGMQPLGQARSADGAWSLWASGVINVAKRLPSGGVGLDVDTDGLSGGADRAFGPNWSLGLGAGYGSGDTKIGADGTRLDSHNVVVSAYSSYHPRDAAFVDVVLGYGQSSQNTRRFIPATSNYVTGDRDGDQLFGAVTVGWDLTRGLWRVSPYGRISTIKGKLDAYTETGDPLWALTYLEQDVNLTNAGLGAKVSRPYVFGDSVVTPRLRVEYLRELKDLGVSAIRYADWAASPIYTSALPGVDRDRFVVGLGGDFSRGAFNLSFDYETVTDRGSSQDHTFRLGGQFKF